MRVRALAYHDVADPRDMDSTGFPGAMAARFKLTPDLFREHLAAIAERLRNSPITTDVGEKLATSRDDGWMLTFDDGGASAHSRIAPMLDKLGWRGHFFIVTDSIGKPGYMDRSQIRELRTAGHVIGTHTCSHPYPIANLDPSVQRAEWERSLMVLSDILGEKVDSAALPGGSYSRQAASLAAAAGVRFLFTLEPIHRPAMAGNCLVIGRHLIRRKTPSARAAAYAAGSPAHCLTNRLEWSLRKIPKRLGGTTYERLKRCLLD